MAAKISLISSNLVLWLNGASHTRPSEMCQRCRPMPPLRFPCPLHFDDAQVAAERKETGSATQADVGGGGVEKDITRPRPATHQSSRQLITAAATSSLLAGQGWGPRGLLAPFLETRVGRGSPAVVLVVFFCSRGQRGRCWERTSPGFPSPHTPGRASCVVWLTAG